MNGEDGKLTDTSDGAAAGAEMAVEAARDAEAAPVEEAAPPTCDHNWQRCPFYCPACDKTFVISDEPVAWRRRVRVFKGDQVDLGGEDERDADNESGVLLTELAGWSDGEDPPPWP